MLYMVLYTLTSLPMMPRPGTQALVVSRADKIYISALFASSLVRNNIYPRITERATKRVSVLSLCFDQRQETFVSLGLFRTTTNL